MSESLAEATVGDSPRRRTFLAMWAGQVVSIFGSRLTAFALGVWVFEQTGSATWFAAVALATNLPAILISPIAGAFVDRHDRRRVMMLSDAAAGVASFVLLGLVLSDRLEMWHLYAMAATVSLCGAFQFPAFSASVTLLLPKQQFARASGMVQLGRTGADVVAPLAAGALLPIAGLAGVIALDLTTFLVALGILFCLRVPSPERRPSAAKAALLQEAKVGWIYIRERPGLLRLLGLIAVLNLWIPLALVLTTPMVLGFAGVAELGLVLGLGSGGALAGSLVLTAWGGPRDKIRGLLSFTPAVALGLTLAGLRPSVALSAVGLFGAMFFLPLINGCSQAVWQSKVPPELQGRVFAVRRMIAQATAPLAFVLAGPLADGVFSPLLLPGGAAVPTLGAWWGVGPGRGIGLLFALLGVCLLALGVAARASRRLTALEEEIPDAVPAH
ncbi:MAG: MFS transporter [Acidobacteriota bacterium]